MKRYASFILLIFLSGFIYPVTVSAQEDEEVEIRDVAKSKTTRPDPVPFPFRANTGDSEYDLLIELSDPEVKRKYKDIFRKYNLPYNAVSFEEIVLHAASADPALELVVITEAADNRLLIGTGNPLYRKNLLKLLRPVLRDEAGFDKFMKSMQEE